MEEILASIRRIIEDSDVERKREPEGMSAAVAPAANDVPDTNKGVEAFRAEFLNGPEPDAPVQPVMEADGGETAQPHDLPTAAAAQPLSGGASPAFLEEAPSAAAHGPAGSVEDMDFPADAFDELDSMPEMIEERRAPEPGPLAEAASRPRLISEQTGRQVAASFGELSEAFAASRRRSFDEMAEEMLRPMLQDWLDNNLPHLVERLVREEIERIARG